MTSDEPKKEKKRLDPDQRKKAFGPADIPPITAYAMRLERAVLRVRHAWGDAILAVADKGDVDAALDKVDAEITRMFGIVQHHHRQKREGGA